MVENKIHFHHLQSMARRHRFTIVMASLIVLAGCKKPSATVPPAPATNSVQFHLNKAQLKLLTMKVWLGETELETEIARTAIQLHTGMMFREQMAENEAMLFVFPDAGQRSFYMANTKIPLTCAYIDPQGKILEIYDMKPLDETSIPSVSDQIQYVLETRQGWYQRNKIGIGTVVRTEMGSLYDTFFSQKKK